MVGTGYSIRRGFALLLALALSTATGFGAEEERGLRRELATRPFANGIRGITVGPIENALHPGLGYGTAASERTFHNLKRMGANWVSLTPFGRVWDLEPTGVSWSFEMPYQENRRALAQAVEQAHRAGLRVMLVPHLWVETGGWRALIDPGDELGWRRWIEAYGAFVLAWADFAEGNGVDLLSLGVESRSWLSQHYASDFFELVEQVRRSYGGPLTYASNWDDVEHTAIWSQLDVIGINAFYPLVHKESAGFEEMQEGARDVRARLRKLQARWGKPIVFTEMGYTARPDPALRPWEWPEDLDSPRVDSAAQASAYLALLSPMLEEPWFLGFFSWRVYADYYDLSQEPSWGFSPLHREAESVLRAIFRAPFAADGPGHVGRSLGLAPLEGVGRY